MSERGAWQRLVDAICWRLMHGTVRAKPNFRIEKLKLNHGDRIVVKVDDDLDNATRKRYITEIRGSLPEGVYAIMIDRRIELSVLAAPQKENVVTAPVTL